MTPQDANTVAVPIRWAWVLGAYTLLGAIVSTYSLLDLLADLWDRVWRAMWHRRGEWL